MLALPLMLALLASCGGPEPAAPDGATPPVSLGRGGTKGPGASITFMLDVAGGVNDPVPFYSSGDVTLVLSKDATGVGTAISPSRGTAVLDDDLDPTLSNTRTWPSLAAGNCLLIPTGAPSNMVPSQVTCDPSSALRHPENLTFEQITVNAGERVVCTYVFEQF